MRPRQIDRTEVGERLALLRVALDVPQVEICRRTGISTSSWNRFERGQRLILPDQALSLYDAYGIDANFIYFGREDGVPAPILERFRRLRAKY